MVVYAEYHHSPMILVENGPDFEKWVLYPAWRDALRRLGNAGCPVVAAHCAVLSI